MQRFERSREPPPAVLKSREADRNRTALRDFLRTDSRKRAQTKAPQTVLSLNDGSIIDALARLFRGKCAFCEMRVRTAPYRFRPPGEARPFVASEVGHLYYIWLADAWENIYPICDSCRPGEADYFPVEGDRAPLPDDKQIDQYVEEAIGLWRDHPPQEVALLLDPCGQGEFYRDFRVELSGTFVPRTGPAATTIRHFNLNRPALLRARRKKFRDRLDELITGLATPHETGRPLNELFNFADLEFGGSWFLLLRRLVKAMGDAGMPKMSASRSGIAASFLRLYGRPDLRNGLRAARATVVEQDIAGVLPAEAPQPRRSHAQLTSVRVRNFRSIESLDLVMPAGQLAAETKTVVPAPSILILGENAAGKSSLLEAITLVLADPAARTALGLRTGRLPLDPAFMGAGTPTVPRYAEVALTLDGLRSRILTISESGYEDRVEADVPIPPVFAYGAFRHYADRRRKYSPAKYIQSLFRQDGLLSNPERWLLSLNETRFDMVVRALRDIFSVEGEFDVMQRDRQAKRCMIITRMPAPGGGFIDVPTPLEIASSGFRSVLAMVCDIFEGLMDPRVHDGFETLTAARAVVLVDEVEAHLHPRWKMQIMRGLRAALPNVTFIATTHDPLCLRGMSDGEVMVMQKVPGREIQGTDLPVFVEQLHNLPSISGLTLEQLLTSDLFQLFSTDAPETDARLATIGDLLARQRMGEPLDESEREIITRFDADIGAALPVGSSEVHRLVQDAVVEYLRERRTASEDRLRDLKGAARERIVNALRSI